MSSIGKIVVIGLFLSSGALSADGGDFHLQATCTHSSKSLRCVEFVRNYDGDTFTVDIPGVHPLLGQKITVRVNGVDAPEMDSGSSCERRVAERAQEELQTMLESASRIDLNEIGRDKYFRVLADVEVDGQSLSQRLIRKRLAVPYDGGTKSPVDWCRY